MILGKGTKSVWIMHYRGQPKQVEALGWENSRLVIGNISQTNDVLDSYPHWRGFLFYWNRCSVVIPTQSLTWSKLRTAAIMGETTEAAGNQSSVFSDIFNFFCIWFALNLC